jgi:hypothetical protein
LADVLDRAARVLAGHWLDGAGADVDERVTPHSDMLVPRYDRTARSGQYVAVWLRDGEVLVSDRCGDLGQAIKLLAQHRRLPGWVVRGLDDAIDTVVLCLRFKVPWVTSDLLDRELASLIDVRARRNVRTRAS